MTTPTLDQQIRSFLASRLEMDADQISEDASYNGLILQWMAREQGVPVEHVDDPAGSDGIRDSAGGELLVLMDLEKEFEFEMTLEEARSIMTVADIVEIVRGYKEEG